jgi:hypothetical protein
VVKHIGQQMGGASLKTCRSHPQNSHDRTGVSVDNGPTSFMVLFSLEALSIPWHLSVPSHGRKEISADEPIEGQFQRWHEGR